MRISDWSSDVCSSDLGDLDIVSQVISAGSPHLATPLTGAMCLACAAAVPGTVVADIAGDAARGERPLRIGHPSGVIELSRSEERRGGKECGSTCRSWLSPSH